MLKTFVSRPASLFRRCFRLTLLAGVTALALPLSAVQAVPTVTTPASASLTMNSATLGGNLTTDGGATITARGVVFSLSSVNFSPQLGGTGVTNLVASGTPLGVFTANATQLAPGGTYSFKAYATNAAGTGYTTAGIFNAEATTGTTNSGTATPNPFNNMQPSATATWVIALRGVFPSQGGSGTSDPILGEIRLLSFSSGSLNSSSSWVACNGQFLPINQNQALFSLLGTTFGGNGQTTFALPDMRGRVVIGVGQGDGLTNRVLGERGGGESGTLVPANVSDHTHTYSGGSTVATHTATAFNNMQPYLVLTPALMGTGIFPIEVGWVRFFAFNFIPGGFLACDGGIMPILQNTALFSLLGTMYGGDGKSTFARPDLRGRTPIGIGQGPGLTPREWGEMGGSETNTLTALQIPAHTHSYSGGTTGSAGANQPFDLLQPYLVLPTLISPYGVYGDSVNQQPAVGEIRVMVSSRALDYGWMSSEGALLPISEYETLFQLIGTTYGGDGESTFALPNLASRAMVAAGQGPGLSSNRMLGEQWGTEQVTITSAQFPAHTHTFNTDPVFNGGATATFTLAEDAAAVNISSQLGVVDPDLGQVLTWSVSGGPSNGGILGGFPATASTAGSTAIILPSGLTYTPGADRNGTDTFSIDVSDGTIVDTITVNVTITPVNDAPTGVNDALTDVAEDSAPRTTTFASLLLNDLKGPTIPNNESGQTLTVTAVSSAVGGTAVISGTNVLFTPAANFNGTASFVYTLQDNGATNGANDFKTATATASFTVTAVNDAPTVSLNTGLTLLEGGTATIAATQLAFTDVEQAAAALTYTITTAATNGTLKKSGVTVALSGTFTQADINNSLITFVHDGGETISASFGFSVSDGAGGSVTAQTFTFTITPVNDNPTTPTDANVAANSVTEGAANGSIVGITASSSDPEAAPIVYSLTNNAGGRFAINSSTGVVTVASTSLIDFETTTSHSITVQASDGTGGISTQTFTVAVANAAPSTSVDSDIAANEIAEASANGSTVGVTASASDPSGGTVTYSLTDSAGGRFAISSTTGVVTLADTTLIVRSSATSHTITVRAADSSALASTQTFTIAVLVPANTAPVITASIGTTAFTEGNNVTSVPVVIDAALTLTDTENATLPSATVSITGNFHSAEDALAFANDALSMSNIAVASNTAGVLSLTSAGATATVAQWQAALRAVTYTNSSQLPNTAARTISFTASDGALTGTSATKLVSVASVDDAPIITGLDADRAYVEGATAVVLGSAATVSDLDLAVAGNYAGVTLTVQRHGGADAQDIFAVNGLTISGGTLSDSDLGQLGTATNAAGVLTVTFTSSPNLASVDTVNRVLNNLTYRNSSTTPPASVLLDVVVSDGTAIVQGSGGPLSATGQITVTIAAVNDAPTLATISDPSAILEDATAQTVNLGGIAAGGGETQTLSVTATSSNTALIPNPTVTYTSPATTASLNYTPVANASGTAVITVTVQDNGGTTNGGIATATRTFTVAVTAVNDAPTLATISDPAAILEDATAQTVNLTGITAGGGETQTLIVTATSSNTALIPNPTVSYTSPATTGSLGYTPVANTSGTAVITVTVQDAGLAIATRTFTVAVTSVNDTPTLAAISDPAAILEDAGAQTVSLTGIGAGGGETQTLTVTATSSNTSLIPNPTVTYTSPAATGSLSYTPVANASGTAVITVTVQDNGGTANSAIDLVTRTFTVAVSAINDMPTLAAISNPAAILEDATAQTVSLTGIGAGGGETQTLIVTAMSSNTALIPNPTVSYTSPAATGSLVYTPVANASGTAIITVTVQDNGGTANGAVDLITRTFTVAVTSVNDTPTLAAISDPAAILEDATAQTVNLTGITAGGGETQTLTVTATSSNTALIPNPTVSYTSPAATGSLSYTPVANISGTAVITVTVQDNGGTANGAVDLITRTFTVAVTSVNDTPTLAAISDPAAILEDATAQTVNLTGIGAGGGGAETQTLTVTATSNNTALIANPTVTYASPGTTGSLSYTPVANANGTAVITVTVQDSGGTSSGATDTVTRTFTVAVTAVNDAPTLATIANPTAIFQDATAQTIALTGIAAGGGETQALTITATSSNTALIPNPTVSYTSPAATGSLGYTPVAGASGSATITVTLQDNGGTANSGVDTVTRTFTVAVTDNVAPAAPSTPDLTAASDTGVSNTDNITRITIPVFTGTAEAGSTVKLFAGSTQIGSTTATGGNWIITSSALTEGTYAITATATDASSNVSAASAALSVTILTSAPAAPAVTAISDDTGSSATDHITSDTTLHLLGTSAANATVLVARAGAWQPLPSLSPTTALADFNGDGFLDRAVVIAIVNRVDVSLGNSDGTFQTAVSYTVGGFPIGVIAGDLNADGRTDLVVLNSSGGSISVLLGVGDGTFAAAANYATDSSPQSLTLGDFNGDSRPDVLVGCAGGKLNVLLNSAVTPGRFAAFQSYAIPTANTANVGLYLDGVLGLTIADSNGDWDFDYTATTLASGAYTFTAVQTDAAGNLSALSAPLAVTIDATVPGAPSTPDLDAGSDSGSSIVDNITSVTTPTFSGTAESGSTVKLFSGSTQIGSATATGGAWTIVSLALSAGTYAITTTATDTSGNVGAASSALSVVIDTVAPAFSSAATASGSYNAAFSYTAAATGAPTSFSSTTLPTGLALDVGTGIISGTPTQTGATTVTLTAKDAAGNSSTFDLALTIAKAAPVITWSAPAAIGYGTALSATQLNATADVAGTFVYAPASAAMLNAGAGQALGVVFTPTDSTNYSSVTGATTLTVNKAALTFTANAATRVYGAVNPVFTASASGFVNSETTAILSGAPLLTAATATSISSIGTYPIAAAAGTLAAANYAFTFVDGALAITQATADLVLGGLTQNYDGSSKSVGATSTPSGLTVNFTYNGSALAPTNAGSYAIVARVADTNFTGTATGTLTIAPATLRVTFGGLSQTYDRAAKSVTTANVPDDVVLAITYNGGTSAPVNAGSYAVSATTTNPNYAGTATETLVIAKASQTVAFSAPSVTIGTAATLSATATSDLPVTFSVVSGSATIASGNTLLVTGAGTVTLRATQAGNENYLPATADANLGNIGKLAQTIAFSDLADESSTATAFGLDATASSGLPVSFTVMSGPATLAGRMVSLTGVAGTVRIAATQAGDPTYLAAVTVMRTFNVTTAGPRVFIAELMTGSTKVGDVAAVMPSTGGEGSLVIVAPGANVDLAFDFTLLPDGTFVKVIVDNNVTPFALAPETRTARSDPIAAAQRTLTLRGRLDGNVLSGRFDEIDVAFSTTVQARGATTSAAGFYKSETLNSATGATYTIVGNNGEVLALTVNGTTAVGGRTTLAPDGTFAITSGSTALHGAIDTVTTSVSGTVSQAGKPDTNFSGVAASTLHTDRIINLSSRARISPAGDHTLITGFVIGGSTPKRVLLRAIGPSLAQFGIAGALANPQLKLFDSGGNVLVENDDWTGAETATAATQVGAFVLAAGSRDAALVTTLAPGAYTMLLMDSGGTGVVLAEIYDASVNPSGEAQRLINISSRGMVEAGEGVLIGGFVVTGNSPKRMLIRGAGPSLTQFGVAGVLSDPRVSVYSNSTMIAQNDDWGTPASVGPGQVAATAAEVAAAAQATGAFAFNAGTKDAALIVTLAPGAYTAQVAGAGGTAGVALVEIYEIPE